MRKTKHYLEDNYKNNLLKYKAIMVSYMLVDHY